MNCTLALSNIVAITYLLAVITAKTYTQMGGPLPPTFASTSGFGMVRKKCLPPRRLADIKSSAHRHEIDANTAGERLARRLWNKAHPCRRYKLSDVPNKLKARRAAQEKLY
uniref:Putative secreted protein n=1 Tax=Ixodes ricinus TaxID=34613 RepID=A0A6B0UJI8_IXORI